jgi:N-methylhydantoinase A
VYAAHYGYADLPGVPLEATTWKLEMTAPSPGGTVISHAGQTVVGEAHKGHRRAYFPEAGGLIECPVYDRYALGPHTTLTGPAIVEERETTVVLLPGDSARVDAYRNLLVDIARPEG